MWLWKTQCLHSLERLEEVALAYEQDVNLNVLGWKMYSLCYCTQVGVWLWKGQCLHSLGRLEEVALGYEQDVNLNI